MNQSLLQELLGMQASDQACRNTVMTKFDSNTAVTEQESRQLEFVDRVNCYRMQEVISQYGWPGLTLVGAEGAAASLLLVLHADWNVPFQKDCLELLRNAVADNEAPAQHVAFLEDRICVNEGRPQRYGTQLKNVDGHFVYADIEDVGSLNNRRRELGLNDLSLYPR